MPRDNDLLMWLRNFPLLDCDDIYSTYRQSNEISGDFIKYYKIRGAMLSDIKWSKKFAEFKAVPDSEFHEHTYHMPIYHDLFAEFERQFTDSYWPFMTSIVSDPEVRADPEYPLLTPNDILKFYLFESVAGPCMRERFVAHFLQYTKEDIMTWAARCRKNVKYDKLLSRAYSKKRQYTRR